MKVKELNKDKVLRSRRRTRLARESLECSPGYQERHGASQGKSSEIYHTSLAICCHSEGCKDLDHSSRCISGLGVACVWGWKPRINVST